MLEQRCGSVHWASARASRSFDEDGSAVWSRGSTSARSSMAVMSAKVPAHAAAAQRSFMG